MKFIARRTRRRVGWGIDPRGGQHGMWCGCTTDKAFRVCDVRGREHGGACGMAGGGAVMMDIGRRVQFEAAVMMGGDVQAKEIDAMRGHLRARQSARESPGDT